MAHTAVCECGTEEQTADHIITSCPIFHHPSRGIGLETVDDETVLADQYLSYLKSFPERETSIPHEEEEFVSKCWVNVVIITKWSLPYPYCPGQGQVPPSLKNLSKIKIFRAAIGKLREKSGILRQRQGII